MGPPWIVVVIRSGDRGTTCAEYTKEEVARAAYDELCLATDPTIQTVYLASVRSQGTRP